MAEAYVDPSLRRRNARHALSDLFLDTELQDFNYQSIALRLRKTGFSLDELERIYTEEVAPSLHNNLNATAGAWTAFDPAWLDEKIDRNKGWILLLKKSGFIWRWYKKWITRDTIADWNQIRNMISVSEANNA